MPARHTRYAEVEPYRTKDGSEIRELMHPDRHEVRGQSLAEATVPEGGSTRLHRHRLSEEVYHVTTGRGRMVLGDTSFGIIAGDTVVIPPGTPHRVSSLGPGPLKILCACAPAYSHEDTELLEETVPPDPAPKAGGPPEAP
jgi:mannose-6-phosphate isomerase-like protein (cupin superfamily)